MQRTYRKKPYRIISIVVLTCFLFNSVSFAVDINLPIASQTNLDKLATPSMCDDLVGIEHKDMGSIEFALMMYFQQHLSWISQAEYLDDQSLEQLGELKLNRYGGQKFHKVKNLPIALFFNDKESKALPNDYYLIKCRIADKKAEPNARTYYVVFSRIRDKHGKFPIIETYTKKQYKEIEPIIEELVEAYKLPHTKKEDRTAINRYIQHEKIIDRWIRYKMGNPDDYIKIGPSYMKNFLDIVFAYGRTFQNLDFVFQGKLRNLLQTRNIVLIKVKKGEERPVIYEDGKEIEVGSHTSENNSYIFMDEEYTFSNDTSKTLTFDNFRRFLQYGIILNGDSELYGFDATFFGTAFVFADIGIIPKLSHIAGEMCGLPFEVTKDGKIINDMDRLYQAAKGKNLYDISRMPLVNELDKKLSLVNLDYLRGTPERPYERDYALMIRHPGDEDENLPISQDLEGRINIIWKKAGEKINEPFSPEASPSPEAQEAFEQILRVTNITARPKSPATANADTYYKICTASLFGAGDYKNVIAFFEWVRDLSEEFEDFRSGVLGNSNFRTLYFIACRLDRKIIEETAQEQMDIYKYSAKMLLSGDLLFMREFLQIQYGEEDFKEKIVPSIRGLVILFKSRKDYAKALEIVENNIFLVESQSEFRPVLKQAIKEGFLKYWYAERDIIRIWQIILSRYSVEEVKPEHVKLVIIRAKEKGLNTEKEILDEYERIRSWGGFARFSRGKKEEGYGTGEFAARKTITEITAMANEVGIEIAPPVENYTLFVSQDFITDEEYDGPTGDKHEYGDRFSLKRLTTNDDIDVIANNIARAIEESNGKTSPEDIIVQLSSTFWKPGNANKLETLKAKCKGVKFIVVDTDGLKTDPKKKKYRENIYSTMLLTRTLDNKLKKENPVLYNKALVILTFLVRQHLKYRGKDRITLVNEYVQALINNNIALLLQRILSAIPIEKLELLDKETVAATLISA